MQDTRRVSLVATSPAQRANRHARPTVAILSPIAVLVVLALLLLPVGPTLTWIMGLSLLMLAVAIVIARWRTASNRPLSATSPTLQAAALASTVLIGSAASRYFISLLLPLLGPPESPTTTLLWSLPTVVLLTAFLVWAARPSRHSSEGP